MSEDHAANMTNEITREEHEGYINAKRSIYPPLTYYQNVSLVSGYNFYGFAPPGSNPTISMFKLLRHTILTGEVLFGAGNPRFIHTWSVSSMPSISYS